MELKDMTLTELKALAYDRLALMERCQLELRQINDIIAKGQTDEQDKLPEADGNKRVPESTPQSGKQRTKKDS